MKYTIEFELPDNDTILNERIIMVDWAYAGYSGRCRAKPKTKEPKPAKGGDANEIDRCNKKHR